MPSPLLSLYESWPINPPQRLRLIQDYGFDHSLPRQYAIWLQRLVTGAWGTSRYSQRLVFQESWYATAHTLVLLAWTGVVGGVGLALRHRRQRRLPARAPDIPGPTWYYVLGALPGFLIAAILREILLGPLGGHSWARLPIFDPYYFLYPFYMFPPAAILALSAFCSWRLISSPRAASPPQAPWYSWQQRRHSIWLHLELFFLEVYLMEYVFSFPGLGKLGIEAIKRRDVPLLQGFLLCTGFLYLLIGWFCERHKAADCPDTPQTQPASSRPIPPRANTYSPLWSLCLLGGLTLSAPSFFWYDPMEMHSRDQFLAPGYRYLCGTDFLGRDLMSRTLGGFRSSIPRVIVLAILLGSVHWLAGKTISSLRPRVLQRLWSTSCLCLQALPHLALAFMGFLVFESQPWALEISLMLACLPAVLRYMADNATFLHRLRQGARLGERLLMLEITFYFLNLSAESFAPTWGSDLRHGMHYGHITPWMLVFPTLAVVWSRYTLSRLGDTGPSAAGGLQHWPHTTTPQDETASAR